MTAPLRLLDCFSGIGGFSYAAEHLVGGFTTTQFIELNPYCQRVLQRHWPDVPLHDDVRTFTAAPATYDVLTAGFPCQDLSSAGKQEGLAGHRSGLFYEVIRLAREIRPRFVILENVANLVSHQNGETFQEVLFQIARAGFDAEWAVVSARDVGACHLRKRVWVIAHAQGQLRDDCGLANPTKPTGASPELGDRGSSDASYPNGERQQEQHPAPLSNNQRRTCWGHAPRPLNPDWRSYLSKPVICRGNDGLSNRVDRLKTLGNAVVPHVAAIPLRRVLELATTPPPTEITHCAQ